MVMQRTRLSDNAAWSGLARQVASHRCWFRPWPRASSLPAVCALLLLQVLACAPDRERLARPDTPEAEFVLGPATEYAVPAQPGEAISDSISGGSFVFPDGGQGTLAVARILESSQAGPPGAEGFAVEYGGYELLELHLQCGGDSIPLLYVYGSGDVSPSGPTESLESWWPVMPEDSLNSPAVFRLVAPGIPDYTPAVTGLLSTGGTLGAQRLTAPAAPTATSPQSYHFMRKTITDAQPEWANRNELAKLTRWTIEDVIEGLPAGLQDFARSETSGRLALRSYEIVPAMDISAYSPFEYWPTLIGGPYRRVYPVMNFVCGGPALATEATVAHEVGHYFTHVFFGDDAFEEFFRAQLVTKHDIGSFHAQRNMLEEYAMFVDYFKNGDITGGNNVEEPNQLLMRSPSVVDVPALEAYATCLLARMHVTRDSIENFDSFKEDIPIVGMSFAELFSLLYTRKPTNANQLRAELALLLTDRNQQDRLPAILERTGWSYNGWGTVLDKDDHKVVGAEVQAVCTVGSLDGREYFAPLDPVVTDDKGRFTLPRLFPGTNMIRVTHQGLEQDFPYTVDPNTATDVEQSLGQLKLEESVINILRRLKYVAIYCDGVFIQNDGHELNHLVGNTYGYFHTGQWAGGTFTNHYADSTETTYGRTTSEIFDCSASFSNDGRTLLRLQCTVNDYARNEGKLFSSSTQTIDIDELPLTHLNTEEPGYYSAYFELRTTQIEPHLRSISAIERYHETGLPDLVKTVTTFNWLNETYPGYVAVVLYEYSAGGGER
jgi:hypothetical protein